MPRQPKSAAASTEAVEALADELAWLRSRLGATRARTLDDRTLRRILEGADSAPVIRRLANQRAASAGTESAKILQLMSDALASASGSDAGWLRRLLLLDPTAEETAGQARARCWRDANVGQSKWRADIEPRLIGRLAHAFWDAAQRPAGDLDSPEFPARFLDLARELSRYVAVTELSMHQTHGANRAPVTIYSNRAFRVLTDRLDYYPFRYNLAGAVTTRIASVQGGRSTDFVLEDRAAGSSVCLIDLERVLRRGQPHRIAILQQVTRVSREPNPFFGYLAQKNSETRLTVRVDFHPDALPRRVFSGSAPLGSFPSEPDDVRLEKLQPSQRVRATERVFPRLRWGWVYGYWWEWD